MTHLFSNPTVIAEYPLTAGQRALWFLQQLHPDNVANNVYQAVIIQDALDAQALENALNQVIARHEALRTTFGIGSDGAPVQRVHQAMPVHLGVTDARGWDEDDLQEAILAEALRPFDLAKGPLLRAHAWQLEPGRYALMLAMHHVITDLWSLALITYEWGQFLAQARTGRRPRTPKLRRSYRDFVENEIQQLATADAQERLDFWREQLASAPATLELPSDFPRPPRQSYAAGVVIAAADAKLTAALRELARQYELPLHDLMLASYQAFLHRYTGQNDLIVGMLRAGRSPAFARVVGYFVNPVPLRTRLSPDLSFIDFLKRVHAAGRQAVANELPFSLLVEKLTPVRDAARNPVFQALFSWQKTSALLDRKAVSAFILHESGGDMDVAGTPLRSITLKRWVTQFDVSLMVGEGDDDLALTLEYNVDILREETARAMLQAYLALLSDIVTHAQAPISRLNLVDAAMQARLLAWGNITLDIRGDLGETPDHQRSIPARFSRQAAATPHAVALALGDEIMTYAALDARSNQLANALLSRGVGPEDVVALRFRPSFEMMIAILGALKAGACYLPLAAAWPWARLRYMIEDSGARLILGDQPKAGDALSPLDPITDWLVITDDFLDAFPATAPDIHPHPDNAAYVIYTSGTTGHPKGVVVTHANVLQLMAAAQTHFHFDADDVWTLFHSYAFDFSVWEMWGALFHGGRLLIVPRELARDPDAFYQLLADERVTVLNQTPSAFRQLMAVEDRRQTPADLALRWVIFGGEALEFTTLQRWFQRHGDRRPQLVNMYGITETTVHVTWRPLSQADAKRPVSLIGPPLPHLHLLLLDANAQLLPIGAVGEIYVGGAGVARGYRRRPALTAERFIPHPFSSGKHAASAFTRLYRSGDLARWTPDGDLQYIARSDHQIQIRGYRVEPGEIAAVLAERPDVRAAAVLPRGDDAYSENIRLAAYIVPAGETAPEPDALRAWLRERLPSYMIPAAFVILPELPLTVQGKIDRNALPEPDWSAAVRTGQGRHPETPLQTALAAMWEELLGVADVGIEDDFFALGGHSLLVVRMLSRVEDLFDVHIPVRDFFDAPTIAALAEKIEERRLRITEQPLAEMLPLPRPSVITHHQPLPSPAQQRLWLLHQLSPDSPVYHIPAAVHLRGSLDIASLESAINRIIARHESLRTVFIAENGHPVPKLLSELHIQLAFTDLTHLASDDRLPAARAQAEDLARKPFDLESGPLLRAGVWRLREDDHLLALVLHHIIADGWSVRVFLQELQTLYLDPAAPLPDLPLQYADYAAWQRSRLTEDYLQSRLAFWRDYLAGAPPHLQLPTDRPRPPVKNQAGAVYRFKISPEVVAGIHALARAAGATPFMAFLGAFATLLARYAGQNDLVIGTAVANRRHPDLEALIGYFVNTLPLRLQLDLDASFHDLLIHTRDATLAAFTHQETPFEAIVETVQPHRDLNRSPLFQVMFSLQEDPISAIQLPALHLEPLPLETETARYDLTLLLTENGDALDGWLEYSTELWDEQSIGGMMQTYRTLLAHIAAEPQRPLAIQPLLTPQEASILTRAWNPPTLPLPDGVIPEHFARQAAAAPQAIAAEENDQSLTYAQLDARSNQLAHALLARGLRTEDPVAVIMSPGLDWLIALLGILKAGGAYLPIEPASPPERIRFILQDSGAKLIIRPGAAHTTLRDLATVPTLYITDEDVIAQPETPPTLAIHAQNAAYIIYTSGTTGHPKGVVIPHQAVTHLVKKTDYLQIRPGQRIAQAANPAFDAATFEIWGPLLNRGQVVFIPQNTLLDPEALADYLLKKRIDVLFLTTALFNFVAAHRPDAFKSLEYLLFGGQAVTPHWVRAVLDAGPPQHLLHVYGPTETTTFATWSEVTAAPIGATTIPIGAPIAHTTCHVLDEAMQPTPPLVVGMLFIGGPGLARGYLRRPDLTAGRFLPDPLQESRQRQTSSSSRLYLTGDLVRRRHDGSIEFIGRADRQLKLRGFRIEPQEIEHAFREHPAIEDALVRAVVLPGQHHPTLIAYLIAREPIAASQLRPHLARRLPHYMTPAAYIFLDAFPLTPNGKVDESALPLPAEALPDATPFEPPQTPLEQTIADIWAELLGRSPIGRHDDFFVLGGHSLLAAQAMARINQSLGVHLPLRTFFDAPTPAGLAEKIDAQGFMVHEQPAAEMLPIPALPPNHQSSLSFAQQRLWFLQQLEPDSSFYNISIALELHGRLNRSALETALNHIIARHDNLRTIFPLENDSPIARVLPELQLDIPCYDANGLAEARAFAELLARQPFHLSRPPLLRAQCYRLNQQHHVLALSLHHIIADGWSLGVMIRELAEFYRAELESTAPQLPELSIQYADFAAWQRRQLHSGILEADLAYWRERLADLPPALDLPTDRPRPPVQTYRGEHITFTLDADLTAALRRFANKHDATMFMVTLAAFQILLHRYSGQDDLAVGAAIANREHPQLEPLIGFFVNTLVMRADFTDDPAISSFIQRTRERTLEAFAHQNAPFAEVVEALHPPRDLARNPLVQTLFVFQNAFQHLPQLPGLNWRYLDIEPGSVKFDLTLSLAEVDDTLMGVFGYASDLFSQNSIHRFIEHYRLLLRAMIDEPEAAVSRLSILASSERQQLLAWAASPEPARASPAAFHSIVAQFETQAAATPAAIAIEAPLDDAAALTYADLNVRANQLAHALSRRHIGPGDIVGVHLPRSPEAIIAFLGILKAGAAYLPLDASLPPERLKFMLEDAGAKIVISLQSEISSAFDVTAGMDTPVDRLPFTESTFRNEPTANPTVQIDPSFPAYIIYTSGVTGRPKGVIVPHRALSNYIRTALTAFEFTAQDRALQFSSLAFDAAVEEIFATLVAGATLVLRNDEIIGDVATFFAFCQDHHLTILDLPTSFWHFLAETALTHNYPPPQSLRLIIIGGERARPDLLRRWLLRHPHRPAIINTYGPTEATVVTTMWRAQPSFASEKSPAQVPIGRPIPGARVYILDKHLRPAPIGVPGELFIGGAGLAYGYLNRPTLTAERFIPDALTQLHNPVIPNPPAGERLYRTGDRVRWLEDGRLEFLGRLDQQVKISGYRIEPEEVAAVLAEHPAVQESAVLATHQNETPTLVAYIIPNGETPGVIELLDFLRLRLPGYMLPAHIHIVDALPRTPGGKVDVKTLAQMQSVSAPSDITPPRTPLEHALAALWEDVLDARPVGVHDNFFTLGGDSLRAAIFINRLQEQLKQPVFVAVLFDASTIAELAALLERDYPKAVAQWLPEHVLPHDKHALSNVSAVTDADIQSFGRILSALDHDSASEAAYRASLPDPLPSAIFLLAAPRSGSTLLRVMLAGHPQLFAPPELYLASFHSMAERAAALSGRRRGWTEGLLRAIMALFDCDLDRARAILARYEAADWPVHQFYERLQSWLSGRTLVDKTTAYPLSLQTLERIESTFRNARYIHLIRNPHASVHSYLNSGLDAVYLPDTPFTRRQRAELIWLHANRNIHDFLSHIPAERRILLRFEELVQAPEEKLRHLSQFLGIDFLPALLNPYQDDRMTDGVHPESRMVGDPNFLRRHAIDPDAASAWLDAPLDAPLHPASLALYSQIAPDGASLSIIPARALAAAPLSFSQERLWFLAQLQPDDRLYHMAAAAHLRGAFHRDAFIASLNTIIARHTSLRTVFAETDDGPVQRILSEISLPLEEKDLRSSPAEERLEQAIRWVQELAARPFDLTQGPLLRVGLYRLDDQHHVIAVVMHHIISDGWSAAVFLRELAALYRTGNDISAAALPALHIQYADYAAWQREWLSRDRLERQLDFWRQHLQDAPTLLKLPTDSPRPAIKGGQAGVVRFHIPRRLRHDLQRLAQEMGATPFMAFWGAFAALLTRYANQDDIVIGTATANRHRPELEPLIGFFVNTLALRLRLDDNPTFRDLLARARSVAQAAFAHSETPFELVVEALQPRRDLSHTPIFQVMFAYQNQLDTPGHGDMGLEPLELDPAGAPYDLSLTLAEREEGMAGQWLYDASLFRPETIQRLTGHFLTLLENLLADPDRPVGRQPILTAAELAQLAAWNDTTAPLPDGLIPDLIARQARRHPDAPAITLLDQTLSYAQLDARANQIAHLLIRQGVAPEDVVAIHLPRGPELLTAILGVMRAGAAFLALDPALPAARLHAMVDDASPRVMIGQPLPHHLTSEVDAPLLTLPLTHCDDAPTSPPAIPLHPHNAAYIIYTSGTTGQPKGAVLSHGSFTNFIVDYARAFGFSATDRMLQFASFAFDAALCESFMPLISGAELIFAPESVRLHPDALTHFLEEEALSVVLLTPTVLSRTRPPAGSALRAVIAAGEACTWEIVQSWGGSGRDFFNGYGPTEATIGCARHRVSLDDAELARSVPIGKPIANARLHVLSPHGMRQPVGVPGELFIGGLPVGRGYLHRPRLTAERFGPDAYVEAGLAGSRLYRTGDLVRRLPSGDLEFLGRVDRQVKFHGIRIELGEIEAALAQHPAVEQAVARLWQQDDAGTGEKNPSSEQWLVAYVVTHDAVTADELRRFATHHLPTYMLPARIYFLEELPITHTGKVDMHALPSPHQAPVAENRQPPVTSLEQTIAEIWRQFLHVSDVARYDDFFALGGHSLLAARIASRLSQALEMEVPLAWLFQYPTPAALAAKIEAQISASVSAKPSLLDPQFASDTDTAPLSFAQQRLWFLEHLEPGQPVYHIPLAVRLQGPLSSSRLQAALNRIIARHASLRTIFSEPSPESAATASGPVQRVLPHLRLHLPIFDLRDLDESQRLDEARRLARAAADQPFNLAQGPLVRAQLYRLGENDHIFSLTLHHIIADGWSVGVLLHELETLYQRPDASLPHLPIQYPQYARWQRTWLSGQRLQQELSFWQQHLADAPPLLKLPTDSPRPPVRSSQGAVVRLPLPEHLVAGLHRLAREAGATPFMAFWGAFATLLARAANQDDIIIGTAVANRNHPDLESLIGLFVNAIALRLRFDENISYQDLLEQTRRVAQEAFAHAEAPFELVVDAIQPPRDLRITPIFQVAFAYNQDMLPPITLPRLAIEPLPLDASIAKYDLMLAISDENGRAEAIFQYSTDLWQKASIQQMAADFVALLGALISHPDASLAHLAAASLPPLSIQHSPPASVGVPAPESIASQQSDDGHPHSATEQLLLDLWRSALRRETISVHDNFFEIGGDSILITHIVARAQEIGLPLSARQFFQHPTIAQLAAHLPGALTAPAEQGRIIGPAPLTPIQRWFFAQEMPQPHHWNQSLLLETAEAIDAQRLHQALAAVTEHHDMLRARFSLTPGGWRQEILAETPLAFQSLQLAGLSPDEQEAEAARITHHTQAALNLTDGPIFAMIHFDFGKNRPNRVLWVVHHLVVDSVSWRILLTDLLSAYRQLATESTVHLPPKTTSYRQWSQHLETFARSGAMNAEKDYWLRALPHTLTPLPVDTPRAASYPRLVETARYIDIELSLIETDRLLAWTRTLSNAELQDALLLSLVRTWAERLGETSLYLDVEGHGRDEMSLPVNLARTIGWFTALYPLMLQLPDDSAPHEALSAIHQQARQAADHAQTYGLLRYNLNDPDIAQRPQPQILFNFLGEMDAAPVPGIRFLTDPHLRGPERSPQNPRSHIIVITAMLSQGRLRFLWEYDAATHTPDAIHTLAQTTLDHLRTLLQNSYPDDDFPDELMDEIEL